MTDTPTGEGPEEDRKGFCMYCGKTFEMADETDAEVQRVYEEAIKHDQVCEKNPLVARAALADRMAEALKVFAREADQWTPNTPKSERLWGRLHGWTGTTWSMDQMEATGIEVIDLIKAKEILAEHASLTPAAEEGEKP